MNDFVNDDKASVDIYVDKIAATTQVFPDDADKYADAVDGKNAKRLANTLKSQTRDLSNIRSANLEKEETSSLRRSKYAQAQDEPASDSSKNKKNKSGKSTGDQGNVAVRGKVLASRSQPAQRTTASNKKYTDIVNERNSRSKKEKNKKRFAFLKFLIIYAIVLLVLAAVGCVIFAIYLNNYENTRPDTFAAEVAERYTDTDTLTAFLKKNSDTIDCIDSTDDVISAYITYVSDAEFAYVEAPDSTDETPSYYITANGTTVAWFSLAAADEDIFRLTEWDLDELDILSYLPDLQEITVLAPVGASVLCNGEEISEEYITSEGVPAILEAAADYIDELPEFTTYTFSTVSDSITITGTDTDGSGIDFVSSGTIYAGGTSTDEDLILSVSARTEVALSEFAQYIIETSNSLSDFVLPGSELYIELFGDEETEASYGSVFTLADVASYEFSDFEAANYTFYTDSCFTVTVNFTADLEITDESLSSAVITYTSTWLWIKQDGTWYLCYADAEPEFTVSMS